MTDSFRPTLIRAKALGRALLQVYQAEERTTPAELLELLDIAQARLERAGYPTVSTPALTNPN